MGMTLRQYMDGRLRWVMFEKGLQAEWNTLNQVINSLSGSGAAPGNDIGAIDITAAAGLGKSTTKTFSGTFAPGAQAGGTGFLVPPADVSGTVGPLPARQSQKLPIAGFRTTT